MVESLFIQNLAEIKPDFVFIIPVLYRSFNIVKHFLGFQVCTTMSWSFQ